MHYVYVLQSVQSQFTYVGTTCDLQRRLERHNEGQVSSTKLYAPLRLVYYEAYLAQEDARMREQKLKHHGSVIGHLKKRIRHSLYTPFHLKSNIV